MDFGINLHRGHARTMPVSWGKCEGAIGHRRMLLQRLTQRLRLVVLGSELGGAVEEGKGHRLLLREAFGDFCDEARGETEVSGARVGGQAFHRETSSAGVASHTFTV